MSNTPLLCVAGAAGVAAAIAIFAPEQAEAAGGAAADAGSSMLDAICNVPAPDFSNLDTPSICDPCDLGSFEDLGSAFSEVGDGAADLWSAAGEGALDAGEWAQDTAMPAMGDAAQDAGTWIQ